MAYIPNSNSVVGFQSQPSSLLVGASVIGLTPVNVTNNITVNPSSVYVVNPVSTLSISSTSGPSSVQLLAGNAVIGSVTALQGTNPWVINQPSPSIIAYQLAGSVMAISGSFSAGNSSVTAYQGGVWATSMVGGPININSILGTYQENNATVSSAFGVPFLFKNNTTTSTLSTVSSSNPLPISNSSVQVLGALAPSSVSGVGVFNTNHIGNGSVLAVLTRSSVAVLQGTNPWIINMPSPSVVATQIAGSVMAVSASLVGLSPVMLRDIGGQAINSLGPTDGSSNAITALTVGAYPVVFNGTNWDRLRGNSSIGALVSTGASSIIAVGTYAEDSAHTTADKGLFTLGVRNDTMASITSADGDYSPIVVGPSGEQIIANSPITKWVQGATSVMYGTSVQVLAAPGASIFTYITGINVINESATASRVTITQGLGRVPASMLTWAIAPAGGGSNATFPNPIRVLDNNGVSASISGVSSVYVTITGFNAKL